MLISSHRKLLLSKAMVVSVAERWDETAGKVERGERNQTADECRKRIGDAKTGGGHSFGISLGDA